MEAPISKQATAVKMLMLIEDVEGNEWTQRSRTTMLELLADLEGPVSERDISRGAVVRADFNEVVDRLRISTADDPVITPWGNGLLARLEVLRTRLPFLAMPPAEGQQSATGAGTDARGQVNPGDSMDVDSTPALATSAAAAPPAATTSVPSTPAKDDALTTGGWGGAWNAWGPGTAVYDAGGQRYPSRTEGVASPAPANAAAKAILASRTRTEAPEESHEGSPAPSKGKGKQRATAVEAQKVPAPPKLRALQDDFRHDPPKSAVFLPDHHADSVFPCDYCSKARTARRCFFPRVPPQGVFKCTNCRRDRKKCSLAPHSKPEAAEETAANVREPTPAAAIAAVAHATPTGGHRAISVLDSPLPVRPEFQEGSARVPARDLLLSVDMPPLPDSHVRMGPHRRVVPSYPEDPIMSDRFACTHSFLRSAFDEQRERIKWVDRFRREARLQSVAGQTSSFNFIDHSHQLITALQADSTAVDESDGQELFETLVRMRDLRATALVRPDSGAIEYNEAFWAMVDMLINSLARLGFGGD
ncbi:hypothetical protein BJ912DRAFT_1152674 [Pholiota molesta]|nr:hypothetical protein BJ912DRAFT_1152674 [Pholiota molesta]